MSSHYTTVYISNSSTGQSIMTLESNLLPRFANKNYQRIRLTWLCRFAVNISPEDHSKSGQDNKGCGVLRTNRLPVTTF